MSRPASRSSSLVVPPSRNNTSLYLQQGSSTPSSYNQHTTTFGHRLMHIFDKERYAVFVANVIIQELGNVPQIDGEFAVRWKFRGKRPKHGNVIASASAPQGNLKPKASLPNVKLGSQPLSTKPSDSTISLRSTSTSSSSSPISPLSPNRPNITRAQTSQRPLGTGMNKSITLPPPAFTPLPAPVRLPSKLGPEKKVSDPTPLRQSTAANRESSSELPMDSPEQLLVEEPEEEREGLGIVYGSRKGSNGSGGSRSSTGTSASVPEIDLTKPTPSNTGYSLNVSSIRPVSAISSTSSTSHLSVPLPRPNAHTNLTEVDSISSSRKSFDSANTSETSLTSLTPTFNPIKQNRQTSSSSIAVGKIGTVVPSTNRKGSTGPKRLHAHTCTWDFEIQYMIKVPLSKQGSGSGSATPNSTRDGKGKPPGPSFPVLGAGPLSDSGIRLIIEQKSNTSTKTHGGEGETREKSAERVVFGIVDVDLATFAGKGKTTRRFLLRGSRTNATIRLTVDMRWVGGEEQWVAPPMQTGHYVTGMADLVGDPAETLRSDLNLQKTSSNSSGSSPVSSTSNLPSATSSLGMSHNPSSVSLVGPAPNIAYKSYEHHLLRPEPPPDGRRGRTTSKDSRSSTPDGKSGHYRSGQLDFIPGTASAHDAARLDPSPNPSLSHRASKFKRAHHHHHSHHFRPNNDQASTPSWGLPELAPDVIIEAVWNPHPGTEDGPFTFIPREITEESGEGDLPEQSVVLAQEHGGGVDEKGVLPREGRRLWVRRSKSMRERHRRDKAGSKAVLA